MKTSHIFWGILFIGLGLLILINNFSTLFMDWATIWKLWPLVVILLGVSLLVRHKYGKSFIAGLAAVILALAIFASFKTATHIFSNDFEVVFGDEGNGNYVITDYTEQFDSTLEFATLNFDAGAGTFKILNSTENLFDAKTEGRKDYFDLTRYDSDSSSNIDFGMHKPRIRFGFSSYKNKVEMNLNPQPVWDLYFDVGAAKMDFDLSEVRTKKIDIDMGAASIKLKIGKSFPETFVKIDAGASDIDIFVPEESGCEINTDDVLSSNNFEGFVLKESDTYRTSNFDEAAKKIYIEIDCGVSSISVKRY